jgi:hypothetical protein
VYESGEATAIPDLRQANCPMLTHRGYGPGLLVPLGTPGNTRGVLLLGKLAERAPFDGNIRRMLHAFSVQAGVALELAEARRDSERIVVLEERDRIAKDLPGLRRAYIADVEHRILTKPGRMLRRVILMSGDPMPQQPDWPVELSRCAVLHKPFSLDNLMTTVQEVLASAASDSNLKEGNGNP